MTPLYHPRPERWPQFSLRRLLIATTLTALLLPWAVAEYRAWIEIVHVEMSDTEPLPGPIE